MSLSSESHQKLTTALTPEVIDYINKDQRYVIFMQEIIQDAIKEKMGMIHEELMFELSMSIMDNMMFIPLAK